MPSAMGIPQISGAAMAMQQMPRAAFKYNPAMRNPPQAVPGQQVQPVVSNLDLLVWIFVRFRDAGSRKQNIILYPHELVGYLLTMVAQH